jgi:hypothetical protein
MDYGDDREIKGFELQLLESANSVSRFISRHIEHAWSTASRFYATWCQHNTLYLLSAGSRGSPLEEDPEQESS